MSKRLYCGCVIGYYWCSKHDIYTKQDPSDPPHRARMIDDAVPESCSCHISAPCSFCVREELIPMTEEHPLRPPLTLGNSVESKERIKTMREQESICCTCKLNIPSGCKTPIRESDVVKGIGVIGCKRYESDEKKSRYYGAWHMPGYPQILQGKDEGE